MRNSIIIACNGWSFVSFDADVDLVGTVTSNGHYLFRLASRFLPSNNHRYFTEILLLFIIKSENLHKINSRFPIASSLMVNRTKSFLYDIYSLVSFGTIKFSETCKIGLYNILLSFLFLKGSKKFGS
jgi:hypothetical protein